MIGQVQTSQICTPCFSEASASGRAGMNSCATWPLKPRLRDRAHDRAVIQLLRFIDLVPAGNAAGVVMREVLLVLAGWWRSRRPP